MIRLLITMFMVVWSTVCIAGTAQVWPKNITTDDGACGLDAEARQFLVEKFGHRSIDEISFADFDNDPIVITGPFADHQALLHLSDDDVRTIFVTTYPQHWVWSEIDHVVFSPDSVKLADAYGINEYAVGGTSLAGRLPANVTLYSRVIGTLRKASAIYAHETGHANCWAHDRTMSERARWQLFYDLSRRWFRGTNCYPSDYVDAIENSDPLMKNYLQVQEYWAELCQGYFDDPVQLMRYPADYQLVDGWVHQQDPYFDPYSAKRLRTEAIWKHEVRRLSVERQAALRHYRQRWLTALTIRQLNGQQIGPNVSLSWTAGLLERTTNWRLGHGQASSLASITTEWVNERLPFSHLGHVH